MRYLDDTHGVRCPCCDKDLRVEMLDGKVVLRIGESIELSEDEVTKILKENNIEFG